MKEPMPNGRHVPVKLFETADRLSVAAPTPGLLPQDLAIEVTSEDRLVLHGEMRGVTADYQLFHRLDQADTSGSTAVEEHRVPPDPACVHYRTCAGRTPAG